MKNQTQTKKGYVLFANSTQAFNAIRRLDQQFIWKVRLSVRLYESPQERRKNMMSSNEGGYNNYNNYNNGYS